MSTKNAIETPVLYNVEAEEAVLGSLLIDPAAYTDVAPLLTSDDYYIRKNGWIHEAICTIVERGEQIDLVALCDELDRSGRLEETGGMAYLTHLMNVVPSALHATQYAGIVSEYGARRRLLDAATIAAKAAHDTDAHLDDVLARAEAAVLSVRRADSTGIAAAQLMDQLYDLVTDWMNNPLREGEVRGLATGIGPLDRALGGLGQGLYLVAARPSMGKTALVLQIAANVASLGQRVVVFSLELDADEIGLRMACSRAHVPLDRLRRGEAEGEEYSKVIQAIGEISEWPLTIHSGGAPRASDVRAVVQRQQAHAGVALVIVDGLGLMESVKDAETRNLELGSISRDLKITANTLGVPIIAVHQLSRAVEQRADKRPLMSDLRESGRLEEDADVILMLYREGYYDATSPEANLAEVWIRKNRLGGPAGRAVQLYWMEELMWFAPVQYGISVE